MANNIQTIKARVSSPAKRIQVKTVQSGNLPTSNPSLTGTVNVNGELVLAPGTAIHTNPVSVSFLDNTTQVITIGDKTTDRIIELEYVMSDGTNQVSGIMEITHNDVSIFNDDERSLITEDINTINITTTFVGNDIRLNLNGIGPGNSIQFDYVINKILKK